MSAAEMTDFDTTDIVTEEKTLESMRQLAIHEAGHAVAAHFLQNGSDRIVINVEEGRGYQKPSVERVLGGMRFSARDLSSVWALERRWDEVVVTMSGLAAEMLFGTLGDYYGESCDFSSVVDMYNDIHEPWGDDEDEDVDKGDREGCDTRRAFAGFSEFVHFTSYSPDGRRLKRFAPHRRKFEGNPDFVAEALEDAFRFLEDKKHLIGRVADALLESLGDEDGCDTEGFVTTPGWMTGGEIADVIGSAPDEATDVASAAKELGISRRELLLRVEAGFIKAIDFGGMKRIPLSEIRAMLEERKGA